MSNSALDTVITLGLSDVYSLSGLVDWEHTGCADTPRPDPTAVVATPESSSTLLEGRYHLDRVIGEGGCGLVYEARHVAMSRKVAVKVLSAERASANPRIKARFKRESILVSRLEHPNTISVYDAGETDEGMLYIAMEYIEGLALSQLIKKTGPLAPWRVSGILLQILSSLEEAHGLSIIHRDLKPSNILIDDLHGEDRIKVIDFGIAKATDSDSFEWEVIEPLTRTGRFCGTLLYMAPELLQGGKASPVSDLYSLALVGYELLTGKPALTRSEVLARLSSSDMRAPLKLPEQIEVPEHLRAAIDRALCADPTERFQSAAAFMDALEESPSATTVVEEQVPTEDMTHQDAPLPQPLVEEPRGRGWFAWSMMAFGMASLMASLTLAVCAAMVAWKLYQGGIL